MKKTIIIILLLVTVLSSFSQKHNAGIYIYNNGVSGLLADVKFNDVLVATLDGKTERIIYNLFSYGNINISISGKYQVSASINSFNEVISLNVIDGGKYYIEIRLNDNKKIELKYVNYAYGRRSFGSEGPTYCLSANEQSFDPIISNNKNLTSTIINNNVLPDIDVNIPTTTKKNTKTFALIIGNEDYSSRQSNIKAEANVIFAENDAKILKEYCIKTLGLEPQNVFLLTNATLAEINREINVINQIIKRKGEVVNLIFYYAGHGYTNSATKEAVLIPIDGSSSDLSSTINLNKLLNVLSRIGANKITVILDACFSGGGRESGLVSSRSIMVKPDKISLDNKIVVFSATQQDQTALPFHDAKHGLFTYFLLKKIRESKGELTYGELEDFLLKEVGIFSLLINKKAQDPDINVSPAIKNEYRNWKFN